MSQTSPRLDLPLVQAAQAQKHVTVNEALLRLDALVQGVAESRSRSDEPADPLDGQVWLLPAGASGASWAAFGAGQVALFRDGAWQALAPQPGWRFFVRDEACEAYWDADESVWRASGTERPLAAGLSGASTLAWLGETELTGLSGAEVSSDLVIPARTVVFCVSVTTRDPVTGASAFDCGIAGEPAKFGGSLGVAAGASNLGVIGPTAFYSDTPVQLTAVGGDFTGGRVALAIHAWRPVAPDA